MNIRYGKIIYIFLALIVLTSPSFAQITLQVGGGAGVTIPSSDYSGTTIEFYNGENYGLAAGLNLHAKAKAGFGGFVLFAEIDYSSLSNDGESEPGQGTVEITQNIVAVRVGPEFRIDIPLSPVTPYLNGNLALNFFGGEVTFQGVSGVPSGTFDMEAASRFGVGFGAGVIFSLGPLMSLDLGATYNLMNLAGKEYRALAPNQTSRLDAYTSLNDDKDPDFGTDPNDNIIGDSRSISTLQVRVTLMVGL